MTHQLVPYQNSDPIQFAQQLGRAIALSKMVPGCIGEEAGQVVALVCWSEGIHPVQFSRRYHLIDGKPTMRSDAMLAEFRMSGGDHEILESTPDAAHIRLTKGDKSHEVRITWEEAKAERWPFKKDGTTLKDNWATPRGRCAMLWARASSEAVRRMEPEHNSGIYSPEEAMDFSTVASNGHAVPAAAREEGVIDGEIVPPTPAPEAAMPEPEPAATTMTAEELTGEAATENPQCGNRHVEMIETLFKRIGMSPQATLEKRGIKSFAELSKADAEELITRLKARAKN